MQVIMGWKNQWLNMQVIIGWNSKAEFDSSAWFYSKNMFEIAINKWAAFLRLVLEFNIKGM